MDGWMDGTFNIEWRRRAAQESEKKKEGKGEKDGPRCVD